MLNHNFVNFLRCNRAKVFYFGVADHSIHSSVLQQNNRSNSNNSLFNYALEDLPYPLNAINEEEIAVQPNIRNSVRQSNHLPSNDAIQMLQRDPENSLNQKKKNAEIESALRSLKTNLIMLLLFFALCVIIFFPTDEMKHFVWLSYASILKFLLPTVTTISNFGPIREVVKLYLQNLMSRRDVESNLSI